MGNVYYMSPFVEEIIDVVVSEKVAVLLPVPATLVTYCKIEGGGSSFPVVSSVALAKRLARTGVDGFIAEGMECGGHVGG